MTDLGTLPGGTYSRASGINNNGQIVGYSQTASGSEHAFLYSGGTMTDLGTLPGGNDSWATGINNNGQIVGYSYTALADHAFLYSGGTMTDLGTLGGRHAARPVVSMIVVKSLDISYTPSLARLMPFYTPGAR